jgi:hypothetical protein
MYVSCVFVCVCVCVCGKQHQENCEEHTREMKNNISGALIGPFARSIHTQVVQTDTSHVGITAHIST